MIGSAYRTCAVASACARCEVLEEEGLGDDAMANGGLGGGDGDLGEVTTSSVAVGLVAREETAPPQRETAPFNGGSANPTDRPPPGTTK